MKPLLQSIVSYDVLRERNKLTPPDETDALSKLLEQGISSWSRLISSLENNPRRVQRVDNFDYRSSYTYHRKPRSYLWDKADAQIDFDRVLGKLLDTDRLWT